MFMDAAKKKLPIGIEDFEKLRKNGFYYVDKTGMIRELLQNPAEVTLFTRPRRFGKSLNMSMLKYFFEADLDGETPSGHTMMPFGSNEETPSGHTMMPFGSNEEIFRGLEIIITFWTVRCLLQMRSRHFRNY